MASSEVAPAVGTELREGKDNGTADLKRHAEDEVEGASAAKQVKVWQLVEFIQGKYSLISFPAATPHKFTKEKMCNVSLLQW